VDVAGPLLQLARARAAGEGLANVEFRQGDATCTGLPAGGFDAVICVFGVFFAANMEAFAAEMWRLVRPGGTLAVTTWGPGLFEPGNSLFWDCVGEIEPSLYKAFNPWDDITSPTALEDLLARAGVVRAHAEAVSGTHDLDHPDNFWDIVMGSGYRSTVDALSPDQRIKLRVRLLRELRSRAVTAVQTNVVFGAAQRSS
jgi:SAM-dependent methyltransferase